MKHTALITGILLLIIEACIFAPAPIPVSTATAQLTQTALPTDMPTPTDLPTNTPTPTELPTNTWTPTKLPTKTSTPTDLPTDTPRPTKLPTYTYTPTSTRFPTDTPTETKLPTDILTLIVSPTFTSTTPTPTQTQTGTPTSSCPSPTAYIILSVPAENLKVGDAVIVTAKLINDGCGTLGLPEYRLRIQSDGPVSIFSPDNPGAVVHYLGVGPGQSDIVQFELKAVASGQATLTASASYEFHIGYPGPAYWLSSGTREPLIIIVAP